MKKEWIHPDTIAGEAATKERYLRREEINAYFWREVRKGNHILFAAPRRAGKTSIMQDLAENCPEGFACLYEDLEGVNSKNEFCQRLFELILQCIHRTKVREAKDFIADFLKKYSIKEFSLSGFKVESSDIDYEKAINKLLPELKKIELHTVIFLDEFAEVLHKLSKEGHTKDAVDIMHTLRAMRHNNKFRNFTVVYAGSIGLEFVIKTIDRPKLINDLHDVIVAPLTDAEATQLIRQLTRGVTIQFSEETIEHTKKRIHYWLPYFFQLMVDQIDWVAYEMDQPIITNEMVDTAFQRVLNKRKNFDDWLKRLKDYQEAFFSFINDILIHAAHKGRITVREIYDKALDPTFNRREDYMDFVDELVYDGYLAETEEQVYSFTSPFLRQFWIKKFPIYDESYTAIPES